MHRFDYFVAYAGPDEGTAIQVHDLLAVHGKVFLSRLHGTHGVWDEAVAAAQRDSSATVALLSSKCREAFYLKEEIAIAIDLYRKGRHRVIPLLLEPLPSEEIPYGVRRLQQVLVSSTLEAAVMEVVRLAQFSLPSLTRHGASRPRIKITDPAGLTREIELSEDDLVTLGRDPANTVSFTDSHVSARHAEVFVRRGKIWVRDLGSSNGVYLDGRRISQPEAIDLKSVVHLSRNGPSISVLVEGMNKTVLDTG